MGWVGSFYFDTESVGCGYTLFRIFCPLQKRPLAVLTTEQGVDGMGRHNDYQDS